MFLDFSIICQTCRKGVFVSASMVTRSYLSVSLFYLTVSHCVSLGRMEGRQVPNIYIIRLDSERINFFLHKIFVENFGCRINYSRCEEIITYSIVTNRLLEL